MSSLLSGFRPPTQSALKGQHDWTFLVPWGGGGDGALLRYPPSQFYFQWAERAHQLAIASANPHSCLTEPSLWFFVGKEVEESASMSLRPDNQSRRSRSKSPGRRARERSHSNAREPQLYGAADTAAAAPQYEFRQPNHQQYAT